jgi:hypothetical protein
MADEVKVPSIYDRIPVDHYAAIGRAVATWADFEFTVDRAIWRLVNKEQAVVACLTSQYHSVFARMDALISLVDLFRISETICKGLRKFQASLGSLNTQRNRIVHDPRFQRGRDQAIGRFEVTTKAALSFEWKEETIKELTEFCLNVDAKRKEFCDIWLVISDKIEKTPGLLLAKFPRIVLNDLEKLSPTTDT